MAAANETGTAAMLGREEGGSAEQIEVAGSSCEAYQWRVGFWVSVDEVVVAEGEEIWGSYGETAAYIARWPHPFWRDLAGFVAIGSCSSAADPLVRFLLTTRTNSRAVSLRDWIRLQFRRKKAFSHMRLYQDAVRVEYRQGTLTLKCCNSFFEIVIFLMNRKFKRTVFI